MSYSRRSYSGTAQDTTLITSISDTATSATCDDLTGWPDGTGGGFVVIFEPGTASEEKCLASGRSGDTLTGLTRGWEGSAVAHSATTSTVRHGMSATDADEANYAVSQTVGLVAAKGDLLVGSAANAFTVVAAGSTGQVPVWQADGSIAAGTVATALTSAANTGSGETTLSATSTQTLVTSASLATGTYLVISQVPLIVATAPTTITLQHAEGTATATFSPAEKSLYTPVGTTWRDLTSLVTVTGAGTILLTANQDGTDSVVAYPATLIYVKIA